MRVLRKDMKGPDVKKWQLFLIGQGIPLQDADSQFGDKTADATMVFQKNCKLQPDGVVGHQTLAAAMQKGFVVLDDTDESTSGPNWPPKPSFSPLVGVAARQAFYGKFSYQHAPLPDNYEHIKILGNWVADNIVTITIPQLVGIKGAPRDGSIEVHRLVAAQFRALWQAWAAAKLLDRIITYDGAFAPRFVRGSTKTLSNHAFGAAFDINADLNPISTQPPVVGKKGSVRELVPLANEHGFYWGGHYNKRLDGMHFEVAVIKP